MLDCAPWIITTGSNYLLCLSSGHGRATLQRQPAAFQPLLATAGYGVFGQGV